jgi:Zn-dependent protease/CBS domain-containing protein
VGRPFGIPVYVSPSWFIVAFVITLMFEPTAQRLVDRPFSFLVAFTYAVLLYASVFAHELSHSVVARMFGLPVRAITLHVLGGVSEIEREPRSPGPEFLIAFAGPFFSLVLAAAGYLVLDVTSLPPVGHLLLEAVTLANLIVGVFNLLPGLPLDGGRIVRAIVWKITGRPGTATITAGWVGRGLAVGVVMLGAAISVWDNAGQSQRWLSVLWGAVVASFIWVGAGESIRSAKIRDRIPGVNARPLARRVVRVTADLPLAEAIRRANDSGAGAIVVDDHAGRPTGIISESAVLATPEHRRPWVEAGSLARALSADLILPADISGEDLIIAIRRAPASEYLLVESDGDVYGVLAADDLTRAFADL